MTHQQDRSQDAIEFADIESRLRSIPDPVVPQHLLETLLHDVRTTDGAQPSSLMTSSANGVTPQRSRLVFWPVSVAILLVIFGFAVVTVLENRSNSARLATSKLSDDRAGITSEDEATANDVQLILNQTNPQYILTSYSPAHAMVAKTKSEGDPLRIVELSGEWQQASVRRPQLRMECSSQQSSTATPKLLIENFHRYEIPVSNNWFREIKGVESDSTVQFAATIHSMDADAVNLCVQCWSADGRLVGFSACREVSGTARVEVQTDMLQIPEETRTVIFRAALTGTGRAEFSNLRLLTAKRGGTFLTMLQPPVDASPEEGDEKERDETEKWLKRLGTNEVRRFEAMLKLINIGDPAVEPLRRILRDEQQSLQRRWQAAAALGGIGNQEAVTDLLAVLDEKEGTDVLQKVAIEALLKFADKDTKAKLRIWATKDSIPPSLKKFYEDRGKGITVPRRRPPVMPDRSKKVPSKQNSVRWERQFQWVDTHPRALARAKAEKKLVMTVISAYQSPTPTLDIDAGSVSYQLLMRGPLNDPDVKAMTKNHFVLRRIDRRLHSFSRELPLQKNDPLAELGTDSRQVQPPAILFHSSDGTLLGTINRVGVFNSRLTHAALRYVLDQSDLDEPRPATLVDVPSELPNDLANEWVDLKMMHLTGRTEEAARKASDAAMLTDNQTARALFQFVGGKLRHHQSRNAEAKRLLLAAIDGGLPRESEGEAIYWLLDCDLSASEKETADELRLAFTTRTPDSIWTQSFEMRDSLASLHMATAESFDVPASVQGFLGQKPRPPELQKAVALALGYLVASQNKRGDWRSVKGGEFVQRFSEPAVTAICTMAIHDWRQPESGVVLSEDLIRKLKQAEARSLGRLNAYAKALQSRPDAKDYSQVFNQTYALEYFLVLLASDTDNAHLKATAQVFVDALVRHQFEEGGWSYLPESEAVAKRWKGVRPHSFNTAPILIELVNAKRLGLNVDEAVIAKAAESLDRVRSADGAFAYAPNEGFGWLTNHRAAIARDPLCELGLHAAGRRNGVAISNAFKRFHKHRADLEVVRKLYGGSFNPTGHGSYFFAFGYFYAARSLSHVSQPQRKTMAADIQRDLLSIVELDGTWIDFHSYGKPYATGMVLRALHEGLRTQQDD